MLFLQRVCSVALSLSASLLLFSSILQTEVFADAQPTMVQLTAAQSLALFGSSFPAYFYNGTSVETVNFQFVNSSRAVCDNVAACFDSWTYNGETYSIVPPGSKNGFTLNCSPANAPVQQYFDNQLYHNSEWLGLQGGSIIDRTKITDYEFLIYKCNLSDFITPVSSNTYDFQFNVYFSVPLTGLEGWQSLFCTQIGTYGGSSAFGNDPAPVISNVNLGSEIRLYSENPLVPLDVTSDTHAYGSNTVFGYGIHPINTCDPSLASISAPSYNGVNNYLSYFGIFSFQVLDSMFGSPSNITGLSWNIRNISAQYRFLKQGFDPALVSVNDPNSSSYQWDDPACYLMVMCPRLYGNYTSGRPSGSGGDYSAPLNDIIDKLDQIVQNLNIDLDTTNLENTIVTTGNSIVTGIKNLFIPSQTDLINFRLDLEDEFHSFFPAMYTAETKIDSVFRAMEDVSVTESLVFPGVSVDLPTESGGAANFKINSGSVPLKPASDRLGILYDCLAGIIDIVATLAFFNMLRNRFNRFFGEGADE